MNQVKFPYGVSNFAQVATQDFVFVDKTDYIMLLEKEKFASFLRPRRFGKSLWLSVLEYYYDIRQ
ncbi:MAG: AAA family ATPase, partial [Bacteroidia bacterium]|nr:AAA family ATPase [Bacteroidia bacterium]